MAEKIKIIDYTAGYFDKWNQFIEQSNNGTIFHNLKFLGYHGTKFANNEHHLIWLKGNELFAVMPLAVFESENEGKIAKSPYGASWGGVVFSPKFKLKNALQITNSIIEYLAQNSISKVFITTTPSPYYHHYTNVLDFSLLISGFKLYNQDVMHVVELPRDEKDILSLSDRKSRNKSKNALNEFDIHKNVSPNDFYPILLEDKERHKSVPTHTLAELVKINRVFSDKIFFDIAISKNSDAKAGICYFVGNDNCIATFYMSQTNSAIGKNGVNALVVTGMSDAVKKGFKYFDFGCSSYKMRIDNIGVAEFKESFGAAGYARNTYLYEISR